MMKILLLSCYLISFSILYGFQHPHGKPEAVSLFGKRLYPPPLPAEAKKELEENLARARAAYEENPGDVEAIIWLGRRTAYLWHYREAIEIFTRGIKRFPQDARLYRHRGHRYITLREFDNAIADLQKALFLTKGSEDVVEPDGQPNKLNIPTGTLQTNILYHLGLAFYLKGDFHSAMNHFGACRGLSKNDDMLVAATDWEYMAFRRMGPVLDGPDLLKNIRKEMNVIENFAYHRRLLLYKEELPVDSLLNLESATDLDLATYGYGLGNWYLYNGDTERARQIFEKVLAGNYWAAFGYIAAEADLKRLSASK
ncbi:MAG: tetratricopeptide repeat protein [Bacteroidota bacterium]